MLSPSSSASASTSSSFPVMVPVVDEQWELIDDDSLLSPQAPLPSPRAAAVRPSAISASTPASTSTTSSSSTVVPVASSPSLSSSDLERAHARIAELESLNHELMNQNRRLIANVVVLESRVASTEHDLAVAVATLGDARASVSVSVSERDEAAAPAIVAVTTIEELARLRIAHIADQERIATLHALIQNMEAGGVSRGGVRQSRRALAREMAATRRSGAQAALTSRVAHRGLKGASVAAASRATANTRLQPRVNFAPRAYSQRTSSR